MASPEKHECSGIKWKVGDKVLVYGGNSPHNPFRVFCNGVLMVVLEIAHEAGAQWVKCRENDVNENRVTDYWFVAEQLRVA